MLSFKRNQSIVLSCSLLITFSLLILSFTHVIPYIYVKELTYFNIVGGLLFFIISIKNFFRKNNFYLNILFLNSALIIFSNNCLLYSVLLIFISIYFISNYY